MKTPRRYAPMGGSLAPVRVAGFTWNGWQSSAVYAVITPEGYAKLKKELDDLWRKERPEVTKMVRRAASLGDRSENSDHQYNEKRLREIDRRVRYLRIRLSKLRVVEYSPAQEGKAFFGA